MLDVSGNCERISMIRVSRKHAIVLLLVATVGCSSISSTHLKKNSETCGWDTTHLHGIPITLDVPDKFKVEVVETLYYHYTDTDKVGRVLRDTVDGKPVVNRSAQVTVKNKKEIFTVDFVKPGAGQLNTAVDLDPAAQYFSEINNKITDQTIDSITSALGTVGGALSPLLQGKAAGLAPFPEGAAGGGTLKALTKTVAVGYFDVADRHSVEKIHEFLCRHMNGCAPPCAPPLGEAIFVPANPAPSEVPLLAPSQVGIPVAPLAPGLQTWPFPPSPAPVPEK
jgi:hypothetical protein